MQLEAARKIRKSECFGSDRLGRVYFFVSSVDRILVADTAGSFSWYIRDVEYD